MNVCISARQRSGVWILRQESDSGELSPAEREALRGAREQGRQINLGNYGDLGQAAGVWRLEWPKACLERGEIALGLADQFVECCLSSPGIEHQMCAPAQHVSLRTVAHMLATRGERVARAWRYGWIDRITFAMALVAACAVWLYTVWRARKEFGPPPGDTEVLVAVHGEWSNRTRHVLGSCMRPGARASILVLGRPRLSLTEFNELLQQQLGPINARLLRPFSFASALLSGPRGGALCLRGLRLAPRQPFMPPFKELVAMNYRCLLGAASAHWWSAGGSRVAKVVYGHTGLADTTLLELAQQVGGATTVHVVHGISAGLNFTGRSTVARFMCEHDARWHARLGGYGACISEVASRPSYVQGDRGILFLSNHLHPMNPWFQAFGAADEEWSLRQVAEAVDNLGIARKDVVWKPHPVFSQLDPVVREPVLRLVAQLGFREWPAAASIDHATAFRGVISSTSTIALDVLRLGVLPIIFGPAPERLDDAISCFPVRATDAAGIVGAVRAMSDPSKNAELFGSCWQAIGPAVALAEGHGSGAVDTSLDRAAS